MKVIYNLDVPVDSKAPKYSSPIEEPKPSFTPTPVVGEIDKEAQQSAIGPTSLGPPVKKEPTLNSVMTQDLPSLLLTPPTNEPIIVSDESEEEEVKEAKQPLDNSQDIPKDTSNELEHQKVAAEAEAASLKAKPSYPDINQLTTLLVTSLKPKLVKLLASHGFASCLPTKLKELPSKITKLSEEIKELKQHVKDMELELHGDLQEIPSKLETFTSTISSLSS
ncbi:hypothetical protein Tco_1420662 [Tanacetum coccineum]